jgi:hypothetical protein
VLEHLLDCNVCSNHLGLARLASKSEVEYGWLGMPQFPILKEDFCLLTLEFQCSGTISGLVAATPASGFIPPWASIILGVTVGCVSNFSTKSKHSR